MIFLKVYIGDFYEKLSKNSIFVLRLDRYVGQFAWKPQNVYSIDNNM
jgi:hypothetical protein